MGEAPTQPTLTGLPAPRRRRPRAAAGVAEHAPVARVVVDRPVPHLDRPFEYAVPASAASTARPGARVRVRFAGQDVDGFVVARTDVAEHDGELAPLRRVVSDEVVLTPAVLRLARAVADRWAGTLADVLRLAVPPRHARTESEAWPDAERPGDVAASGPLGEHRPDADVGPPSGPWADLVGGPAFLRHLRAGGAPRAVWTALPGPGDPPWAAAVAEAVVAALAGGRGSLVVVPTGADVADVTHALTGAGVPPWSPGTTGGWVRLVAEDGPAARYRAFLAASRGVADVVVGTRAAAFAPVDGLGLAVCWDDGDTSHAEPRAPYPHARDVLAVRAELEGCALLVGGWSRTTTTQRWVERGWAHPVQAERAVVRARVPRVRAMDSVELAREGPAAGARLPSPVLRAVREALGRGPVLVQVPRAGYVPALACGRCRTTARCRECHGPLMLGAAGGLPSCRWCGRLAAGTRCPECGAEALRSVRVGSERTAEELGRAFPGVTVRTSGAGAAGGVLRTVPDRPALVVATPGAEPRAPLGYAAGVLLDAAVMTSRDALGAGEQALRSWLVAAALVRPAGQGGVVLLVGDAAPAPVQALVRWDPAGFAARELAERSELLLPPAVHVVTVEGTRHAVDGLLAQARLPATSEVLGPLPLPDRIPSPAAAPAAPRLLELAEEVVVRAVVRSPWPDGPRATRALAEAVATRSARREPPVRLVAEPVEVL